MSEENWLQTDGRKQLWLRLLRISICPFQGVSKAGVRRWPTEMVSSPPKKGYSGSKGDYFSLSHSLRTCRKCSPWWRNVADLLLGFPASLEPFSHLALEVLPWWHSVGRGWQSREGQWCLCSANCSDHIPQHSSQGPLSHQESTAAFSFLLLCSPLFIQNCACL